MELKVERGRLNYIKLTSLTGYIKRLSVFHFQDESRGFRGPS